MDLFLFFYQGVQLLSKSKNGFLSHFVLLFVFYFCSFWCFRFLHFLISSDSFLFLSSPDFVPDSWLSWFPPPGLCTYSNTNVKPVFSSWFDSVEVWCLHVQIFAILSGLFLFRFISLILLPPPPLSLLLFPPLISVNLTPSLHTEGKWDCV